MGMSDRLPGAPDAKPKKGFWTGVLVALVVAAAVAAIVVLAVRKAAELVERCP
jgi:hypothetical protein